MLVVSVSHDCYHEPEIPQEVTRTEGVLVASTTGQRFSEKHLKSRCAIKLLTIQFTKAQNMRSDEIKQGVERAPHRSLLKALGLTDSDIAKPFIGIASSYTTIVPGHIHLRQLAEAAAQGILSAGRTPLPFTTTTPRASLT